MQASINKHQLNQIVDYIKKEYKTFAVQDKNGKDVLAELDGSSLEIPAKKNIIPFKKILWPNEGTGQQTYGKIAFLAVTSCDAKALDILLREFSETNLLPKRENILVFSSECTPDEFCFCSAFDQKTGSFDLHIQKERDGYSIFSGSTAGERILDENGIKNTRPKPEIREIKLPESDVIKKAVLTKAIADYPVHKDFWQKIANNCFGCGSCTAVCPLCYCIHQELANPLDGSSSRCLKWDSCFSKSFSEIQKHTDLRPKRVNRLYNWYHHKFVRAYESKNHFLCTGCGRCIEACPAHLNQYKIITAIEKNQEEIQSA